MVRVAVLIAVLLLAGASPVKKQVLVNFMCKTGPSAVKMVEGLLWERPEEIPDDCRMISRRALPIPIAEVLEHYALATAPDGRIAEVAYVLRERKEYGYSAGFTDLLLM